MVLYHIQYSPVKETGAVTTGWNSTPIYVVSTLHSKSICPSHFLFLCLHLVCRSLECPTNVGHLFLVIFSPLCKKTSIFPPTWKILFSEVCLKFSSRWSCWSSHLHWMMGTMLSSHPFCETHKCLGCQSYMCVCPMCLTFAASVLFEYASLHLT